MLYSQTTLSITTCSNCPMSRKIKKCSIKSTRVVRNTERIRSPRIGMKTKRIRCKRIVSNTKGIISTKIVRNA